MTSLQQQLKPLLVQMLKMTATSSATTTNTNTNTNTNTASGTLSLARSQSVENVAQLKRQCTATTSVQLIPWCIDVLSALPVPSTPFNSYQDLIKFRLLDPLVKSLVELVAHAIRSYYSQEDAIQLFIKIVYNLPSLRWLLFTVISMTNPSANSLVQLHIYSTNQLHEAGNPVFDPALNHVQLNAHPVILRINEYIALFISVDRDSLINSLHDLLFKYYFESVLSLTSGIDKTADEKEKYRRRLLSFFLTILLATPHIAPHLIPSILPTLRKSKLFTLTLLEHLTKYSHYKPTPISTDTPLSPHLPTIVQRLLLQFMDTPVQGDAVTLVPYLFNVFEVVEELSFGSNDAGDVGVVKGVVEAGVLEEAGRVVRAQGVEILMKLVELLQERFLMHEKDPTCTPATLMTSFETHTDFLCTLYIKRSHHPPPATTITATTTISPHLHLLELAGLWFGKKVAVEILRRVICECAVPLANSPLDPESMEFGGGCGVWNVVEGVKGFSEVWGRRKDGRVSGVYRLALEESVKRLPNETVARNLVYLSVVTKSSEGAAGILCWSETTASILASLWQDLLQAAGSAGEGRVNEWKLVEAVCGDGAGGRVLWGGVETGMFVDVVFELYLRGVCEGLRWRWQRQRQRQRPVNVDALLGEWESGWEVVESMRKIVVERCRGGEEFGRIIEVGIERVMRIQVFGDQNEDEEKDLEVEGGEGGLGSAFKEDAMVVDDDAIGDKDVSFLEDLRDGVGGGARGMVGGCSEGNGGNFEDFQLIEKKEFSRRNVDVLKKLKKKAELEMREKEREPELRYYLRLLFDSCIENQASKKVALTLVALKLQQVLTLRPLNANVPPVPASNDALVLNLLDKHGFLWDLAFRVAEDADAYQHINELVRILLHKYTRFWMRNKKPTQHFAIASEFAATEQLIRLIVVAKELIGCCGITCLQLLPLIPSEEIVRLLDGYREVALIGILASEDSVTNAIQRLRTIVKGIIQRYVVQIGIDLSFYLLLE